MRLRLELGDLGLSLRVLVLHVGQLVFRFGGALQVRMALLLVLAAHGLPHGHLVGKVVAVGLRRGVVLFARSGLTVHGRFDDGVFSLSAIRDGSFQLGCCHAARRSLALSCCANARFAASACFRCGEGSKW